MISLTRQTGAFATILFIVTLTATFVRLYLNPFEAELAAKIGFRICAMGPRILRCETAPLAALIALMYATGNM